MRAEPRGCGGQEARDRRLAVELQNQEFGLNMGDKRLLEER